MISCPRLVTSTAPWLLTIALLTITGCHATAPSPSRPSAPPTAAAEQPENTILASTEAPAPTKPHRFSPPMAFSSRAKDLPEGMRFSPDQGGSVMTDTALFSVTDTGSAMRYDLSTAAISWRARCSGPDAAHQPEGGSLLAWGTDTVYVAVSFPPNAEGKEKKLRVCALDESSGKEKWHGDAAVPTSPGTLWNLSALFHTSAGALLVMESPLNPRSFMFDAATGALRWQVKGKAFANGRTAVIAPCDMIDVGICPLNVATGALGAPIAGAWAGPKVTVAGPDRLALTGSDYGHGTVNRALLVGEEVSDASREAVCRMAGGDVPINLCGRAGPLDVDSLEAVDTRSHATLWKLPAGDRAAPTNIVARGERIYASLGGKGVILDTRTGTQLSDQTGVECFSAVTEFGAVDCRGGWHAAIG